MGDRLRVAPHIINLPAQPPASVSLAEMVQCSALSISGIGRLRISQLSHVESPGGLALPRVEKVSYRTVLRADPFLSRRHLHPSIISFLVGDLTWSLLCDTVISVPGTSVKPSNSVDCLLRNMSLAEHSQTVMRDNGPAQSMSVIRHCAPFGVSRQAACETPEMRRRGAIATLRPCRGAPVIGFSMRHPPPIRA
jgi:hypothetical protein